MKTYEAIAQRLGAPPVSVRVIADDAAHARRILKNENYINVGKVRRVKCTHGSYRTIPHPGRYGELQPYCPVCEDFVEL